jgi:2-polyprenyl-3-methyl-5-hydroxy-6-metoxy-1,4-benzoquinol methylase
LFTRGPGIVWPYVKRWAQEGPIRILDVACGGGDTAIALEHRLKRAGLEATVDGCDLSPTAVRHAQSEAERRNASVRFFEHDVLTDPLPAEYDVIMCSLFLHHLSTDDAVRFLSEAAQTARRSIVVQDLVRNLRGWWLAYTGVRLLLCNDVCREDGPRSVECAFTIEEARKLGEEAGLHNFRVEPRFPCRFVLTCKATS